MATLAAEGAEAWETAAVIAREIADVLDLPQVELWRYERDGTATVLGTWSVRSHPFHPGTRWPVDGPSLAAEVRRTGRPARIDDYSKLPGTIADATRESGVRSAVGAPVMVDGEVWGVMLAGDHDPMPAGSETRLAGFTELVATAISNVEARSALAASRARARHPARGADERRAASGRRGAGLARDDADRQRRERRTAPGRGRGERLLRRRRGAHQRRQAQRRRRAWVNAAVAGGTLRIEVLDDGTGGADADGTGLVGLGDRLAVLGGVLAVQDRPEGGTRVAATIPLA